VATDNHVCAGAIQLAFAPRQNARHRGEVQKLMVHSQYRRRGIGRALADALTRAAIERGLTLLVLDVRSGDAAERLCKRCGFQLVGTVPGFTRSTGGAYEPTSIYYRQLGTAET
jgi:ribosomal protein S18 acetylase RimI-like enzyme